MKRTTLAHTQRARIVIISPTAGSCQAVIPATVAAVIVWFLSCIPAMAAGVVIFQQAAAIRAWWDGWRVYGQGWRDDLGLMWLALCMTARLEFA